MNKFDDYIIDTFKAYDGKITNLKIAEIVGCSNETVRNVLNKNKLRIASKRSSNKCYKCNMSLKFDYKFCPYCGSEILSKDEILIKELNSVKSFIAQLHPNDSSKNIKIINNAINRIKEFQND